MTRAVATSALREAMNRDLFADRIAQVADIEIKTIGPEEEARLIHAAVAEKVNLKNRVGLLVDVGGGSTEITITEDAQILSAESYKMGAVRMLQQLENGRHGERHFHRLLQEYIGAIGKRLRREIGDRTVDLCVGTGGNMETLGDLRREVLGKDRDSLLTSADLEALSRKLQSLSFEERVAQLRLRPDRADVIVPAAAIMLNSSVNFISLYFTKLKKLYIFMIKRACMIMLDHTQRELIEKIGVINEKIGIKSRMGINEVFLQ